MRRRRRGALGALWLAALCSALPACSDVEAAGNELPPDAVPVLTSEAELLERARREISPEAFDEELLRLRAEINGSQRGRKKP